MTQASKSKPDKYLLSASVVRLFGRKIEGVTVDEKQLKDSVTNRQLLALLDAGTKLDLARIYAFSFEGQFYSLPKPILFLVHRDDCVPAGDDTGLANKKDVEFEDGIMRWKFDKDDVTLRADIVIGAVDDVLVDATLSPMSKYPITSRAQEASWRDGQMIARNRLQ